MIHENTKLRKWILKFEFSFCFQVRQANRDLQCLSRTQRREIGLATMLLCVVIVFLICNILPLLSNVYDNLEEDGPPQILVQLGNLLVTINSSINFIIYVIFGRKFKTVFLKLFCGPTFFRPGRDSPEFQTNDESIVTNMTHIEPRNSVKRSKKSISSRNNNSLPNYSGGGNRKSSNPVQISNGHTKNSIRWTYRSSPNYLRSDSPDSCVYYPNRSPTEGGNGNSTQNGWNRNELMHESCM